MKNLIPEHALLKSTQPNTKTYNVLRTLLLVLCSIAYSMNVNATCDNVTDGGQIGADQTICSGENYDITNLALPTGGTGDIEYMWLANTTGPVVSGSTSTFSSSSTMNTGNLSVTTWFARYSRRNGCTTWLDGGSNWIKITITNIGCLSTTSSNIVSTNGNESSGSNNNGKISGVAFNDADADGLQTGSESGIPGIEVFLLDKNDNTVNQTFTNSSGYYEFTSITSGNYKIKVNENVTSVVTNYELTFSNKGADDNKDSDPVRTNNGTATTATVNVSNGQTNDNVDLGYFTTSKIGDETFIDNNVNGLNDNNDLPYKGVTVELKGTDIFGNSISLTDETDDSGKYGFENIVAGSYTLSFIAPDPEFIPTEKNALANILEAVDSDIDEVTARTDAFTITPGVVEKEIDAGFKFNAALPVNLTSFEANIINGSQVILKWVTATEQDNKHFIVEKSIDGREFEPIGVVEGNGTTNTVNYYSFEDLDPFYGNNYYRLKQVDFDGKYEYSEVKSVTVHGQDLPDMIVYPNPVQRSTTLRIINPLTNDATIEVLSNTGQTLQVLQLEKGEDRKQIDMSNYPEGMYYLFINYNGHRTQVSNLVKVEEE